MTLLIDGMLDKIARADESLAAESFTSEVHPYAAQWPMRPADEIEGMAESIRARGLRFPIVLTPDGVLVDGRNRLAACSLAGVEPRFVVDESLTDDDEIVAYIWDSNGDRRDMTKGQKAMLAALAPGTQLFLGNTHGTSQPMVAKARQVKEWCAQETIDAVIAGTTPLNDAYAQAQAIKATEQAEEIARRKADAEARKEAERQAALLADLRDNRPDLASLVDEERLSLADALTTRRAEVDKQRRRAEEKAAAIRRRNADVQAAFATIASLAHDDIVTEVVANWTPLVRDWTAADLCALADTLQHAATRWETK